MAKWSKASDQSSGGLWVKNRAEIFVHVPFCELVPIWSLFLSIIMFKVPPVQF